VTKKTVGIGFRSTAKEVYWAIVEQDSTGLHIRVAEKMRAAKADDFAQKLVDFRSQASSLLKEYGVQTAGVRLAETIARSMGAAAREGAIARNQIEGMLMELIASRGLNYVYGSGSKLKPLAGGRKSLQGYVGGDDFRDIEGWAELSPLEKKEAVYAAVAGLGTIK
jgi:hypothetical protein